MHASGPGLVRLRARRLSKSAADVLAQALNLRFEVELQVGPQRVDLVRQLAEELKAVLFSRLRELVAQHVVELRHNQPVKGVCLFREAVEGLFRHLVLPQLRVGWSRWHSSRKRPLVPR